MLWMAAVGAGLGALFGALSTSRKRKQEKAEIEKQKENARIQYEYGKEYSDNLFNIRKTESLENLGMQQRNLDTQLDLSFDDYNSNLLAQAFGAQDARIQTSSAIGESIAAEGASGTRGNASNEMIRSYVAEGLERNIDIQNKQNDNYLNRMIKGADMSTDAINREKASWLPGGYRIQEKQSQDSYNYNLYQLGKSNFDWQTKQINDNTFLDYFTGITGGASSGFNLGSNFGDYWKQVGK